MRGITNRITRVATVTLSQEHKKENSISKARLGWNAEFPKKRGYSDVAATISTDEKRRAVFLHGSGVGDEQRIFVFTTQQGISLLGENEHWFMDGFF